MSSRKILVVDDEPDIRQIAEMALRYGSDWTVLTAADGAEAVAVAARERPDAIVLDVMMPELDGPGMVRSLRAAPELVDVPIVLMSAADGAAPLDPTIAAFIPKPFDLDDLLAVVARSLRPPTR